MISTYVCWYRERTYCMCCSWYCPLLSFFLLLLFWFVKLRLNIWQKVQKSLEHRNIGQFQKIDISSFTDIFLLTADLMHLKCWHSMELVLGYFSFIQPKRVLTGWEQYQLTSVIWHFKMYVTFCIFSCLCYCKIISNFPRVEKNSHLR